MNCLMEIWFRDSYSFIVMFVSWSYSVDLMHKNKQNIRKSTNVHMLIGNIFSSVFSSLVFVFQFDSFSVSFFYKIAALFMAGALVLKTAAFEF